MARADEVRDALALVRRLRRESDGRTEADPTTPRDYLGRVIAPPAAGNTAPCYRDTHPLAISGNMAEGMVATRTVDVSRKIPVLFLDGIPGANQDVIAHNFRGRWVARLPGAAANSHTLTCQGCTYAASSLILSWRYWAYGSGSPVPPSCGGVRYQGTTTTLLNYSAFVPGYGPGFQSDWFLAPSDSTFGGIYSVTCRYFRFTFACSFGRFALVMELASDGAGSNCGPNSYPLNIYPASGSQCSPFIRNWVGSVYFGPGNPSNSCNAIFADGIITP